VCLLYGTDWIFIYNSTFCPHSVFMCFVCISEQTAIISLYGINWLVCITESECVYCAVRSVSRNIMKLICEMKGRTMPPTVSRRPLNGEVPVRSRISPREICIGQVGLGRVFLRVLPISPVSIIPFMLHSRVSFVYSRCHMRLSIDRLTQYNIYLFFSLSVSRHGGRKYPTVN